VLRALFQNQGHFKQGPIAVQTRVQTKIGKSGGLKQTLNRGRNFPEARPHPVTIFDHYTSAL
jgi:hypothetical protein